ncbi:MAG: RNA methyltransferase [Burkholderiales bacterium]
MRIDDLTRRWRGLGAKPFHSERLLRAWTRGLPLTHASVRVDDLPQAVRAALPELADELARIVRVRTRHPSADGSERLLLDLADGQAVETVLLPRDGVCVSSQVGCAVGCTFCRTGRDGLTRHLHSAEMVAQVVQARALRIVRKVVFMGMGEPAHNLDEVLAAIDVLGTFGDLPHKNLVLSTVGDRRVFERLAAARVRPALALSLHSASAAVRESLLPRAPRIDPAELVALGEAYARATHYPIQYQWTLLAGVNDSDADADAIASLLRGKYAVMNFIPFNAVDGIAHRRPSPERAFAMTRRLIERGVLAKLRDSAGQDVDGGCGQLRARVLRLQPA